MMKVCMQRTNGIYFGNPPGKSNFTLIQCNVKDLRWVSTMQAVVIKNISTSPRLVFFAKKIVSLVSSRRTE
jgi:hypothetical protein